MRSTFAKKSRAGFSMIELMVVILIIGLLAVASAPFTKRWVDGVRQREAVNVLNQAVGQAKSVALRNPNGLNGFTNGVVRLYAPTDGSGTVTVESSLDGGWTNTTTEWTGKLHPSVTVKPFIVGTNFVALDFVTYNNLGVKTACYDTNTTPDSCLTALKLAVTAGSETDALYVELL